MNDIKFELQTALKKAADALRAGASAAEFAAIVYAPGLVVIGEGWPRAIRGIEPFLPDLQALFDGWGPNADLTFSIVDPVVADGTVASTLVDVRVNPRSPAVLAEHYRVVYTWRRMSDGWRVVTEMYAVGSF